MSIEEKQKNSDFKRLYRGAYDYVSNGESYTEEKFEVFKEKRTFENHYESEILTRISTGQIFKVSVSFVVNKAWLPQSIIINRTLGNNFVKEHFDYNTRRNSLRYTYESPHTKNSEKIITPPRFTIQSPAAACSMSFISSKKIDQTAENFYYTFISPNSSLYKGKITNKNVILKRAKLGAVSMIPLGDSTVSATEYLIYDDTQDAEQPKVMHAYISKHLNIPYKLAFDENNYIQIKYLNDFTDSEADDSSNFI